MKRVYISVSGDVVTDQRVLKTAESLHRAGAEVIIVGRKHPGSLPMQAVPFCVRRLGLLFHRGFFFYACLNIRLFLFLVTRKKGLLLANDLDTLPAGFLVSRLRGLSLVYDSHEYFTGAPEIQHRPRVKAFWKLLERKMLPRIRHKYTVNTSIASLYEADYQTHFRVIRNLSKRWDRTDRLSRKELSLPEDRFIMIWQGTGINADRGGEEIIEAVRQLSGVLLLVIGGGTAYNTLKKMAVQEILGGKVIFLDRLPYEKLMQYTACADLGLSLDKPTHLNYLYSLPNKLFDYVQAGIPVLASDLPEIRKIVEEYDLGILTTSHDPVHLADLIRSIQKLAGQKPWEKGLCRAAMELTWDKEEDLLLGIFREAGLEVNSPQE